MLEKEPKHFHHFALELRDIGEMRLLLDHLAKHGRWVIWGPGRHGVAASIFAYIRIPEEDLIVELYCDMEQLAPDHVPRDWEDTPHSSNVWGTLPPRTYFRFDAEAIETERGQLQALGPAPELMRLFSPWSFSPRSSLAAPAAAASRTGPRTSRRATTYAKTAAASESFAITDEQAAGGQLRGRLLDRHMTSASVIKAMLLVAYLRQPSVRGRELTSSRARHARAR